jgi:hypothetical protein
MCATRPERRLAAMPVFLLQHEHEARECAAAFAAWAGFESPLRGRTTECSCLTGGHAIWWRVQAPDQASALALLPRYVAERTTPIETREIQIP